MKEKKVNKIGLIFITVLLTVILSFGSLAVSYFYSPNFQSWVDYTIRQQGTVDEQANIINGQAETITGLQADLTTLNDQLNTVTDQRDVALGEKQQLLLDIVDLEGEIAELQAQLNDALTQNEQDLALIANLQETITAKDNLIAQKNATINNLNSQIGSLNNTIAELEQDIADLTLQIDLITRNNGGPTYYDYIGIWYKSYVQGVHDFDNSYIKILSCDQANALYGTNLTINEMRIEYYNAEGVMTQHYYATYNIYGGFIYQRAVVVGTPSPFLFYLTIYNNNLNSFYDYTSYLASE